MVMNYEDKRKYLESFAYLDLQVEELLCEKKKWLNRALELKGEDSKHDTTASLKKVDALERQIDRTIDKIIDQRDTIINAIERLETQTLKTILFEKYIRAKTFESISEDMGYCERQILRLHKKAIDQLDLS